MDDIEFDIELLRVRPDEKRPHDRSFSLEEPSEWLSLPQAPIH
jgi:phosphopantetheinyl transferase